MVDSLEIATWIVLGTTDVAFDVTRGTESFVGQCFQYASFFKLVTVKLGRSIPITYAQ